MQHWSKMCHKYTVSEAVSWNYDIHYIHINRILIFLLQGVFRNKKLLVVISDLVIKPVVDLVNCSRRFFRANFLFQEQGAKYDRQQKVLRNRLECSHMRSLMTVRTFWNVDTIARQLINFIWPLVFFPTTTSSIHQLRALAFLSCSSHQPTPQNPTPHPFFWVWTEISFQLLCPVILLCSAFCIFVFISMSVWLLLNSAKLQFSTDGENCEKESSGFSQQSSSWSESSACMCPPTCDSSPFPCNIATFCRCKLWPKAWISGIRMSSGKREDTEGKS